MTELTSEVGLIPEKTPESKTTVQIGNEFAHVSISNDAFRKNLVTEAIEQGIPESTAKEYAEKVSVSFEDSSPLREEKDSSIMSRMSNRTRKGGAKKVDVFGMVGTENDGAINVIINAALIARRVTERYKDQYPEAQEMALEQSFDRVWRHERQHVIQEMDPEKKKDMKMKTALATIPVSLGTYGATYAASYALTHGLSHTGTSGDYAIIVTSAISGYMAAKLYGMHYGPIEREAHEMAKPENYKRNSPFKVNFEK